MPFGTTAITFFFEPWQAVSRKQASRMVAAWRIITSVVYRLRACVEAARKDYTRRFGAWLSLVERLVRDQEAGGSNPLAPTISFQD